MQNTRINSARFFLAKLVLRWLNTHIQTFVKNYKNMMLKRKCKSKLMKWVEPHKNSSCSNSWLKLIESASYTTQEIKHLVKNNN